MNLNSINYETNHFGNDWGLYVDIENLNPILPNNNDMFKKYNIKPHEKFSYSFISSNDDIDSNNSIDSLTKDINLDNNKILINKLIVNISSTIITGAITYLILCVI
jgi:hypothetical protein